MQPTAAAERWSYTDCTRLLRLHPSGSGHHGLLNSQMGARHSASASRASPLPLRYPVGFTSPTQWDPQQNMTSVLLQLLLLATRVGGPWRCARIGALSRFSLYPHYFVLLTRYATRCRDTLIASHHVLSGLRRSDTPSNIGMARQSPADRFGPAVQTAVQAISRRAKKPQHHILCY